MGTQVFVANLDYATTEEELAEFFRQAGTVSDIKIPKDRDTGRSRGFAFVRFATEEEAREAIVSLDGATLGSRRLRVRVAEERSGERRTRRKPRAIERLADDDDDDDGPDLDSDLDATDGGSLGSRRPRKKEKRDWRRMRQTKRSL